MHRIALISEHASPLGAPGGRDSGGQNVYVDRLARWLARMGYHVDVFTRRDSPTLPQVVEFAPGARVVHVPAGPAAVVPKEKLLPYMPAFTEWLLRFLNRHGRYDLVHANFFMSGLVAAEVKRACGIPFVVTFHALGRVRRLHQGQADTFPAERLAIEDRIVAEADRIIAECPQDEEDLVRLYGADLDRLAIIPCGFDPEELWPVDKPLARMALGLERDEPLLLQLGRLVPRKGVDTVIRALARLRRRHGITARLLIVGGESEEPDPRATPEIGRLQEIAAAEGVAEAVTFAGRKGREALKFYYSAADVFITTPWYEPFGITPLEAMACGTPVIGANVGGIKYSVRDGETGYLVPPNDPDAVAERAALLLCHPQLRAALGRRAIAHVRTHFTWEEVARRMAALYEELLAPVDGARVTAVRRGLEEAAATLQAAGRFLGPATVTVADHIAACFAQGGKLLICGNGGSAADAQHFAGELVGRFKQPTRPGLPALALCADSAVLTACGNDYGYEDAFARQVEAFGRPGDVLVAISTSGRSRNVIRALETARRLSLGTIALLGGDGGAMQALAEQVLVVPSADTQHVQEAHIALIHLICDLVEQRLTGGPRAGNGRRQQDLPSSPLSWALTSRPPSAINGRGEGRRPSSPAGSGKTAAKRSEAG